MEDPLVETWQIHDRIHRNLLDAIADEALGATLNGTGRGVRNQFAHVHNVRLVWLKAAAPDLLEGLAKLEPKSDHDRARLRAALESSGRAVGTLLARAVAAGGKVKNFKPHAAAFLGYLISHESHHRGKVGWTLKHSGRPLDSKAAFDLWEWSVR